MTQVKGIHDPIDSKWLGGRVSTEVNIQISKCICSLDLVATKCDIILVSILNPHLPYPNLLSSLMYAVHAKKDKASSSDQYRLLSYSSWLGMIASMDGWSYTSRNRTDEIFQFQPFGSTNKTKNTIRLFVRWLIVQVYCKVKIPACVRKHHPVIVDVHSHTDRFWLRKANLWSLYLCMDFTTLTKE